MPTMDLPAGPVDYLDTGGDRPAVVLVPGVVMDHTVWRDVTADLGVDHRVISPTLPLGGHRRPMRPDADLSMTGVADLLGELIRRLDLADVTLVANDWGGPIVTAVRHTDVIDRLVVTPCETFDNVPPGLPGRFTVAAGKVPGALLLAAYGIGIPLVRRMPTTFGQMAVDTVPGDLARGWMHGLRTDARIRRDLRRYLASDPGCLDAVTPELADLDIPTLVAWTTDGRVMPADHGARLAELLPHGHYAEIADARVLVPLDQPATVARLIRDFVRSHPLGIVVSDAAPVGALAATR